MKNFSQRPSMVLFDFDDTLSEHRLFSQRLVGTMAFAMWTFHGGVVERWAESVQRMMMRLENSYIAQFCPPAGMSPFGYRRWFQEAQTRAVHWLYEEAGLEPQANARQLALKGQKVALHRSAALFPRAREVVRGLQLRGFRMSIASGNDSRTLHHALVGCGLRPYFEKLYGADLVDCAKEGPEFYRAIFEDLGIEPSQALVIDNDAASIQWAWKAGARSIQVRLRRSLAEPIAEEALAVFDSLGDLLTFPLLR
ncbi:HAD family hydrolase [Chthonomonas calidirosea]|uniref:HAD family hydrolase n=1 Tax=Chthonomonas calidirosea TaxID=454171 RepID=UPI000948B85F|nr:HAD family hydrolase [Chthonomonas calidirosea]